ncbi:MAG TPA: DUF4159 domain-containing protein [Vicinamibacterales bacterium]|nr:DUF4159 domain-containing protein [Vicinamibacterales bacterium]
MRTSRRTFLASFGAAAGVTLAGPAFAQQPAPARQATTRGPRPFEFVFARLRYDSGDWDYNPKVAANVLDAVIQYTDIAVYPQEVVVPPDSAELAAFPFLFMTGHKLVRFNDKERANLIRFADAGGLLFSDDCNHDVDGLYAKSFEAEMRQMFPGPTTLAKIPNSHQLYRSFFRFPEGPPQTSHELNGWGDDMVHDYLRGVERRNRLGVIYSNKDYGCEWDYDWRNKRFRREDNTRFAVNLVVYSMT